MEAQLDRPGAEVLQRQLEQMGLHVHLAKRTTAVLGDADIAGLAFSDGSTLECEMVVIAAGVRPNVDLARKAGLTVGRGIVVDDDLACVRHPDVFAIGECAEHRGMVYGLVAPVWEQAQVLAERLSGRNPRALYFGSRPSTKLKVAGLDVAVMGDKEMVEEDDEVITYAEPSRGTYKKLIVRDNCLTGAIVIGDGAVVPSLLRLYTESAALPDNRSELLFRATFLPAAQPQAMPDTALVCNCNGVTKAQIIDCVLRGARSLSAVADGTRATTGCGTCRPEVQAIVDVACRGIVEPDVLASPAPLGEARVELPDEGRVVVTQNKIERIKTEKDGFDIVEDVPRIAQEPWQSIDEGDRERLKWAGVFFRRQTPGQFMMRVRMPNGHSNAAQVRELAAISRDVGAEFVDITTRQQIQLRAFRIADVPSIWSRLERVGLTSLQSGMDNVRNVVGCPVAGLTQHELFDASPVAREYTEMFLRNKAYTNLPRKFNVTITGCLEYCTHTETQDLGLIPAVKMIGGEEVKGFNVIVGGKMGSGGYRVATPLDVFVPPEEAATLCSDITLLFRDHGSRATRTRARLASLIEEWGIAKFRVELQRRAGRTLMTAGKDKRSAKSADHLGIVKQRQPGFNYVGLAIPVGRVKVDQLFDLARMAETHGNGDIRLTPSQNVIIPNVPDDKVAQLAAEPLLRECSPDPPGVVRGLVSCTGIDYCHFALIETKEIAMRTARKLAERVPAGKRLSMHWSGCPAGCGNHAAADIGLLGKNARIDGEIVDAVDVFVGGKSGPNAKAGVKILEDVPCADLPGVLERLIPYIGKRTPAYAAAPPRDVKAAAEKTLPSIFEAAGLASKSPGV